MNTVLFVGAGATQAATTGAAVTTKDLLPRAFGTHSGSQEPTVRSPKGYHLDTDSLKTAEEFLCDNFGVPRAPDSRLPSDYPALPTVLSLLDIAIQRKEPFDHSWKVGRLEKARQGIEAAIFWVIDSSLRSRQVRGALLVDLMSKVFGDGGQEPTIISTNYDTLVENALMKLSEKVTGNKRLPAYGCKPVEPFLKKGFDQAKRYGIILKLHGSLSWAQCSVCTTLQTTMTSLGMKEHDEILVPPRERRGKTLRTKQVYQQSRPRCSIQGCSGTVAPVIISPSRLKAYENFHLQRVWHRAAHVLRAADRIVFVGYSLPEDDLEILYLLKRNFRSKESKPLTVVSFYPHISLSTPVGLRSLDVPARFIAAFGNEDLFEWSLGGLEEYVAR